MVQVDVFWAYGFGAGYALSAHRQLKADYDADPAKAEENQWYSKYFVRLLLFISILFAPSGIYLLWNFPDWETMQVATNHRSLPAWLVTAFAITNVTQGILGYWLTRKFITKGNSHGALLSFVLSYIGFFFILVHGWDGTGYQRFFSVNQQEFLTWGERPWHAWLTGPVALTLYGMGVFILPPVFIHASRQFAEGLKLVPKEKLIDSPSQLRSFAEFNFLVFGCGLAPAIVASLLLHTLGLAGGLAAIAVLGWLFCARFLGWVDRRFLMRTVDSPSAGAPGAVAPDPART
ncbi:MAG: hypothetical protein KIT79_03495 [Deltaproteobacteria bacterium]|nr:hypothetical protein [Deltaproteobacteria bacterium]